MAVPAGKEPWVLTVNLKYEEVGRVPGNVCKTGISQTVSVTQAKTKTVLLIAPSPLFSIVPGTQQTFRNYLLNAHCT